MDDEFTFLAGQIAPRGTYIRVDIWVERRVILVERSVLPASCDGRVAVYRLVPELPAWLSNDQARADIEVVV